MSQESFEFISKKNELLRSAIELIFNNSHFETVCHYKLLKLKTIEKRTGNQVENVQMHIEDTEAPDGVSTMLFYWHETTDSKELPFPHSCEGTYCEVREWLNSLTPEEEPVLYQDGKRGFRLFTELKGYNPSNSYFLFGVQPVIIYIGK